MTNALLSTVFLLALGCSAAALSHHPCTCTGNPDPGTHKYQGGNQGHLTYYSLVRLQHPATPNNGAIYCYERQVENHSAQDVRYVDWRVGGYWQGTLPANSAPCEATDLSGELKQTHPMGPLHFGLGSQTPYSTNAYAPKSGWPQYTAKIVPLPPLRQHPKMGASFDVVVSKDGDYVLQPITMTSTVSMEDHNINSYNYEFNNKGTETLYVYWDIPKTEAFDEQFYMDELKPVVLDGGAKIMETVRSSMVPGRAISAVIIRNSDFEIVTQGIATVYGFAEGKRTRKHSVDWSIPEQ